MERGKKLMPQITLRLTEKSLKLFKKLAKQDFEEGKLHGLKPELSAWIRSKLLKVAREEYQEKINEP